MHGEMLVSRPPLKHDHQKSRRKPPPISDHRCLVQYAGQVRAGTQRSYHFALWTSTTCRSPPIRRIDSEPLSAHTVRGGVITFHRQLMARLMEVKGRKKISYISTSISGITTTVGRTVGHSSPDAGHEVIYEAYARDHRRCVTCAVAWVGMR